MSDCEPRGTDTIKRSLRIKKSATLWTYCSVFVSIRDLFVGDDDTCKIKKQQQQNCIKNVNGVKIRINEW